MLALSHTHTLNVCMCLFVGAVAAFVTTPLDVAKTRIMLAKVYTLKRTHGAQHLF